MNIHAREQSNINKQQTYNNNTITNSSSSKLILRKKKVVKLPDSNIVSNTGKRQKFTCLPK